MRKMHEDHPDYNIVPGMMTEQGQAFHDRMLQKEPSAKNIVAQANRLLMAMAWDEWKDKIGHDAPGTGMVSNRGWYYVDHEDGAMVPKGYVPRYSDLTYFHHPDKKRIDIDMLAVYPEFQGRGVGEALMRRLHQDYPDHKINPGSMTDEGQGFYEKMLQKEPTARDLVTAAQRVLMAAADFNPREVTDRLDEEFREWADQNKDTLHPTKPFPPQRDWKNVERFLKDNYPAAHKGFSTGLEQAGEALDRPIKGRRYQTGPKTVEALGYDPKEMAAGMLLLHNRSHPFRMDQSNDLDRLVKIFDKRQQMQREYDSRQPVDHPRQVMAIFKTAVDLVKDYTDGLSKEFHDWARQQEYVPVGFSKNDPLVINPDYTKPMGGPLTYWDNIEGFIKDRYPAAYRGYRYGEENASDALDGRALRMPAQYSPYPNRTHHPNYESGPEAVEKYGYDPRQVAAGFMYLHTNAHEQARPGSRGPHMSRDIDRLSDIFQKRYQMQRNYEQRTAAQAFGDCYQAAGRYMLDSGHLGDPDSPLRVVHGEVAGQGPMRGKTFGHAWVEVHDPDNDEPMVIDPSNGGDLHMPKSQYYSMGKINELNNYHSYTPQEAAKKMTDLQHFGPWDLTVNGEAPPGRMELDDDDDSDECEECGDELDEDGDCFWGH
jgi:GNAT superfamily N-acetyltransferase